MSTWDNKPNDYDHAVEQIARLKAELAAERERCAKIADKYVERTNADIAHSIAREIREK